MIMRRQQRRQRRLLLMIKSIIRSNLMIPTVATAPIENQASQSNRLTCKLVFNGGRIFEGPSAADRNPQLAPAREKSIPGPGATSVHLSESAVNSLIEPTGKCLRLGNKDDYTNIRATYLCHQPAARSSRSQLRAIRHACLQATIANPKRVWSGLREICVRSRREKEDCR